MRNTEENKKEQIMSICKATTCIFYIVTIIANIALIGLALFFASQAYGDEVYIAVLIAIPPILSLIAMKKCGDREERMLKKRIRKAELRKQLKALEEFDTSKDA